MTERMVASDGAEICTEAFGERGDPPVLMIMGQMASMLWWPEGDVRGAGVEHSAAFEELDWSDTQALEELLVRDARLVAGSRHPFDEAAARELVTHDLRRTRNPQGLANHGTRRAGL